MPFLPDTTLTFALGVASAAAFAHGVWVQPRGGSFVVLYGHGDKHDAHDSLRLEALTGVRSHTSSIARSAR